MFSLSTNADEVAAHLVGSVDEAVADADVEVADYALDRIAAKTPRRTGRLAAGLRSVVVAGGFDIVDAVPYASVVDARTGFASETLVAAESDIAAIYDRHLQDRFPQ